MNYNSRQHGESNSQPLPAETLRPKEVRLVVLSVEHLVYLALLLLAVALA